MMIYIICNIKISIFNFKTEQHGAELVDSLALRASNPRTLDLISKQNKSSYVFNLKFGGVAFGSGSPYIAEQFQFRCQKKINFVDVDPLFSRFGVG